MMIYDLTSTFTQSDGDTGSETGSLSGDVITYTNSFTSSGTTTTASSTQTINEASYTFTKEGTYTSVWNTTTISSNTFLVFTTTNTNVSTNTSNGDWSFVGKQKDAYKNKERMVTNALTRTQSDQTTSVTVDDAGIIPAITSVGDLDSWTSNYYSGENSDTWELDMLKGKEMVAKMISSNSGSYSSTPNGGATTTSTNDVSESTVTITFTAK